MLRLAGTLDHAAPALNAMSGGAQARVSHLAARLPAPLTDRLYLERPLGGAADRLDLIVMVGPGGRPLLARGGWLAADEPQAAAWSALQRLAQRWLRQAERWTRDLAALWLEFDLPAGRAAGNPGLPAPRLFIDHDASRQPGIGRRWSARRTLAPLAALGDFPPGQHALLARCIAALPAGAHVPSAGVDRPGGWSTTRLCVAGLTLTSLERYLHQVGWPGDAAALVRWHHRPERTASPDQTIGLVHLDLADRLLPRLGLEYRLPEPGQQAGGLTRHPLLASLVSEGLCDPLVCRQLAAWPLRAVRALPHQLWSSVLVRWVNHIKVVHEGAPAVQAKVYQCLAHAPCARPGSMDSSLARSAGRWPAEQAGPTPPAEWPGVVSPLQFPWPAADVGERK
jgi:hypothetical protein